MKVGHLKKVPTSMSDWGAQDDEFGHWIEHILGS